jgi:hypothetical protein
MAFATLYISWIVFLSTATPCSHVGCYLIFEGTYRFIFIFPSTLKLVTLRSSETFVTTYKSIRCHNPEDLSPHFTAVKTSFYSF